MLKGPFISEFISNDNIVAAILLSMVHMVALVIPSLRSQKNLVLRGLGDERGLTICIKSNSQEPNFGPYWLVTDRFASLSIYGRYQNLRAPILYFSNYILRFIYTLRILSPLFPRRRLNWRSRVLRSTTRKHAMPTRRNGKGLSSQARGLRSQASFSFFSLSFFIFNFFLKNLFFPSFRLEHHQLLCSSRHLFFGLRSQLPKRSVCLSFSCFWKSRFESFRSTVWRYYVLGSWIFKFNKVNIGL